MAKPIIEVKNVTVKYGGFTALSNISAVIPEGELTSIIGPNGAGKSTFFNVICGAVKPTSGEVFAVGQNVTHLPQNHFARIGIAKSFQITSVFPQLTVIDNIRVALQALSNRFDLWTRRDAMRSQIEQAAALLEQVGLADKRLRLAGTLAHGEQRSLEVAMALAASPRVLLLDEPTAGMSPEETRAMMDLVVSLAKGRTIVLVEHKMKLVMGISSRIIVLHHGEILADGSPEVIRASDEVRRVYLGKEAAAA